jgi:MYXO-CTERM domain-containing protein
LAIAIVVATSAHAYVRTTTTRSDAPVQWTIDCIVMQPDARGSQDVSLDQVQTTLQHAIANWTTRTSNCPGLALSMHPPHGPLDVGQDGINAVVFQDKSWSHDATVIGLTTVVYLDLPGQLGDGTILEADIELNGTNYTFSTDPANGVARPGTMLIDLESTMTHELGHVQGLAHTCWDHVTATAPKDNTGMSIPDCNGPLPASITNTTMYPYYGNTGDISKRTLAPDDVAGVCDVYGRIAAHLACYPEIHGGCSVSARPHRSRWQLALVVAALGLAGLFAWRRRR